MKNKIITLIGIDGSGKSTLANLVDKELIKSGQSTVVVWACLRPFLLRPFILAAKYLLVRKHDKFENYDAHIAAKSSGMKKLSWTHSIYFIVMMIDYFPQVFYKVTLPRLLGKTVITDRYYQDLMLDYVIQTNSNSKKLIHLLNLTSKLFPRPDLIYYIKVPCQVAYERKSDIPSLQYLIERDEMYQVISNETNAAVLDGTAPPTDNCKKVLVDLMS